MQDASAAYLAGSYLDSAKLYASCLEQVTGSARRSNAYNAACSFALAGSLNEAFEMLSIAIQAGFIDVAHLEVDSDLTALRDDSRWASMIKDAESRAGEDKRRWGGAAFKTPWTPELTESERLAGLSLIWAEARYGFPNFDQVPDLDWDAAYVAMIPRVLQADTTVRYYRLLKEFIGLLRDGHCSVTPPRVAEVYEASGCIPPLLTDLVQGKVVVEKALGQEFLDAGIRRGDEVLSLDGVSISQYAANAIKPLQASSTAHYLDRITYHWRLLEGPVGPVTLEFRRRDGQVVQVESRRIAGDEWSTVPVKRDPSPPSYAFEMRGDDIAYVQLGTFGDASVTARFSRDFAEISKAQALIIDLRDNGGGSSGVGWDILAHLTDRPFEVTSWRTLRYSAVQRAWGHATEYEEHSGHMWPADDSAHFKGPVAVLIGNHTFSAAEDFVAAFKVLDRGLLVGEPTGGSTGQPLAFDLPGGGWARITVKRDLYPNGTDFVGVGIHPDVLVEPTIDEYAERLDVTWRRAAELLLAD
ncbi:S41 family peptidase [Saltatorellus ferox]|uniref:S41 family peptidase n=1 Tax=Saltatorellus ferox TaxID=2528018 RepID=UPI003AF3D0F7